MPDSNRDRITRAARGLFIMRGYRNTTVDEIAREAGMSKRTVYESFNAKSDIAREVVESELVVFAAQTGDIINSDSEPLEKLRDLSRFYVQLPYPGITPVALIDLQRELPELWARVEAVKQGILSDLRAVIEDGKRRGVFRRDMSSSVTIAALTGALESTMSPDFLQNNSLSLEEVFSGLFELITRGICQEAAVGG
ncbi:MAG: TetR/AcrR family transcriptional regulator [Actinobacteria bacterium]|nr:TetR/AcrR family transcriptional regulator [Actinomycetota bacterium]MBU1942694.1 TetR/AcrR family transcriptional regulator [Actinomycetota bacterium]MBU2686016.1 TetR/AcrR family transcriptional regulator [Actinomycetota bacterium]